MKTTRFTDSAQLFAGAGVPTRLRDGRLVTIRTATLGDAGDISAMHVRCSPDTVYQRYHSAPSMTGRFLSQLVSTDIALVAEAPNHAIIALANLGRDVDDAGELAVIVEDRWQRRGLGSMLLGHLVTMARLVGYREVYSVCLPGHQWFRGTLTRFGPLHSQQAAGYESMRLTLRPAHARLPEELGAA